MDILEKARKSWNEFVIGQTNNISSLMTDKLDDYVLLQEAPMPVIIGKKVIYIATMSYDTEQTTFKQLSAILSNLSTRLIKMDLADERRKELLKRADFKMIANGNYLKEFLLMDKRLKKDLCKLIRNVILKQRMYIMLENDGVRTLKKWKNCSYRYFKKWVSSELLIQMCFLIYLYNFDSQKKSLRVIMDRMHLKSLEETYIPFWLKNLAGVIGTLEPVQVPNIGACYKESENSESLTNHYKEVKNDH